MLIFSFSFCVCCGPVLGGWLGKGIQKRLFEITRLEDYYTRAKYWMILDNVKKKYIDKHNLL
jgi:hypothetical protein